jgi:hypothetical protein
VGPLPELTLGLPSHLSGGFLGQEWSDTGADPLIFHLKFLHELLSLEADSDKVPDYYKRAAVTVCAMVPKRS